MKTPMKLITRAALICTAAAIGVPAVASASTREVCGSRPQATGFSCVIGFKTAVDESTRTGTVMLYRDAVWAGTATLSTFRDGRHKKLTVCSSFGASTSPELRLDSKGYVVGYQDTRPEDFGCSSRHIYYPVTKFRVIDGGDATDWYAPPGPPGAI